MFLHVLSHEMQKHQRFVQHDTALPFGQEKGKLYLAGKFCLNSCYESTALFFWPIVWCVLCIYCMWPKVLVHIKQSKECHLLGCN